MNEGKETQRGCSQLAHTTNVKEYSHIHCKFSHIIILYNEHILAQSLWLSANT